MTMSGMDFSEWLIHNLQVIATANSVGALSLSEQDKAIAAVFSNFISLYGPETARVFENALGSAKPRKALGLRQAAGEEIGDYVKLYPYQSMIMIKEQLNNKGVAISDSTWQFILGSTIKDRVQHIASSTEVYETAIRKNAEKLIISAEESSRLAVDKINSAVDETEKLLSSINDRINESATTKIESILKELNYANTDIEIYKSSAESAAQLIKDQAAGMIHDMNEAKKATEEQIELLRSAQKELSTISPVVALWKSKGDGHSKWLAANIFFFVLVLVGSVLLLYEFGGDYVRGLIDVAGQNNQLAVTALIAAPVLGAAWLLRIISRFMMQNLAMLDDARQRKAIADTFIGLVGEPGVKVSREERALALNALFRAPPGSGEPDVIPPNLIELITGKKD
ncbi:hypothetical protein J2X65_003534 [Ancylobacter sp. 3268]|uniref:hypothetical protein n=1 Tax=Ancylobacter sp. 3268 TaxID=2817752 RepID=UPI0028557DF2|nr:hypothetical protein [Ancylobacter sp. 3268]MDR6954166.1 hypothetical protein [Ancylobacter sp. 3268]